MRPIIPNEPFRSWNDQREPITVARGVDEPRCTTTQPCATCTGTGPVGDGEYRCAVCHDIGLRPDAHGTRQRPVCVWCEPCEVCSADEDAPWPCVLAVWGNDRDCCGDCAGACRCHITEAEDGERGCETHRARV